MYLFAVACTAAAVAWTAAVQRFAPNLDKLLLPKRSSLGAFCSADFSFNLGCLATLASLWLAHMAMYGGPIPSSVCGIYLCMLLIGLAMSQEQRRYALIWIVRWAPIRRIASALIFEPTAVGEKEGQVFARRAGRSSVCCMCGAAAR